MEQVIPYLSGQELLDVAKCVKWEPVIQGTNGHLTLLQSMPTKQQWAWLEANREQLYDEIKKAGRSRWGNFWDTSSRVSYLDSVREVADALDVDLPERGSVAKMEAKIMEELSRKIMAKMTPEQKEEWLAQVRAEAEKHGIRIGVEAAGLGAIGLAQLSGFGIYMAASTVLGAINGALGLGLGFGVFAGLSKLIAFAIGPLGAAIFVVPLIAKFASADAKRLLPIVACISALRNSRAVRFAEACDSDNVSRALKLIKEMDDKAGGKTLAAMCDAQPAGRRTTTFYVVQFLASVMQNNVNLDSLSALKLTTLDIGERGRIAESIIEQVERLAPESLDDVLLSFLATDFCSMRICYLAAPEGSETELACVTQIAEKIAGAVLEPAWSAT